MKPFKEYFNEAYDPANLYNADTSEHIPYDQLHRIGPQIMVNYFNIDADVFSIHPIT